MSESSALSSHEPASSERYCFHCGTENPQDVRWQAELGGQKRTFCCAGCLAIAQTIHAAGLSIFYTTRTAMSPQAVQDATANDEWTVYDEDNVAREFVHRNENGQNEISLLIDGMSCGACVWLIESWLMKQTGVIETRVNYASRRATVLWNPEVTKLSALLRSLSTIGYRAYPYDPKLRDVQARRERRMLLFRMGVALCCMMQVMMMAAPGYLSRDIAANETTILRWGSLVLTLPVMFFSALPFFRGALRDVSIRRLGMDVPISLGLIFAFIGSVWNTVQGMGQVYYDSITMFVALLLIARFVELTARHRSGEAIEAMARQRPMVAERFEQWPEKQTAQTLTAASLDRDDVVLVRAGGLVPADGVVVDGASHVEEAMLTGESWPRKRIAGDCVFAGSVNRENALVVRVSEAGEATRLATILRLADRAASERPRVARIADKAAFWFVSILLTLATIVGAVWLWYAPERALEVVFSLLVISCPCALSLATPTALSAAAGALGRLHVVLSRSDALEALAGVTTIVFDKTGTLTEGEVRLLAMQAWDETQTTRLTRIAQTLEARSEHPIARAFHDNEHDLPRASNVTMVAGMGIEGVVDGERWRIGRAVFVGGAVPGSFTSFLTEHAARTVVFLGNESGICAVFALGDALRPEAAATVARLTAMGVRTVLLSGDNTANVENLAKTISIDVFHGDLTPENKREYVQAMQAKGEVVAMIGDGINDAPGLAQAQISISLGSATSLAQWTADVVILSDELPRLADALICARRTLKIIRQNLCWAALYNVLAIPAAVLGLVTPLLAAVGMSLSSLVVVLNAMRAIRIPPFAHMKEEVFKKEYKWKRSGC